MRRKLIQLTIALCALGFAGCTQDDAPAVQEQEISVAARSTTDSESTTTETFTRDFNLDLWSSENPNKYERHAMSYNDNSWNVVKTSYLDDSTVAAAIAGTATIDFTDDGYDIVVSPSQTDGSVDDYDMMFAYNANVKTSSNALDLHFEHLFVKLTFNIEYGSEFGDTPPEFAFVGFNFNGSLNDKVTISGVQDGNPTPKYSATEGHTVGTSIKKGDTDDKIEVIVGYGTLPAREEFLYLYKKDDYTFESPLIVKTPASGLTFEKGKHYTFKLKVGKDKVELTPTATDDHPGGWDKDTETDLN